MRGVSKKRELELLRKFEVIKSWMIDDVKRAMFDGRANFLAAQGLLIYTEFVGSLITGKGEGNSGDNFDTFFIKLGIGYEALLKRHNRKRKSRPHVIYDDLRCGLVHEYLVKRKIFTIYNANKSMTDTEIRNIHLVELDGTQVNIATGVVFKKDTNGKGHWLIIDPLYWLDFKIALDKYWQEICDENNIDLRKNFFKRAREINLKNFNI